MAKDDNSAVQPPARAFPPSLSRIPTDLDCLYAEAGGPAPIGVELERSAFVFSCREFPWWKLKPVLIEFAPDELTARRHWPWVAFAVDQFQFHRREASKFTEPPTPTEIKEQLKSISSHARRLAEGLVHLQSLSYRVAEPKDSDHVGHLRYLDQFIAQAAAGLIENEVNEGDEHMLHVHLLRINFLERLAGIAVAANAAIDRVDPKLAKRRKPQTIAGIEMLSCRAARVWISMTRRPASTSPSHSIQNRSPDFVRFVQAIVSVAGGQPPSLKVIATALGRGTPNRTGKKVRKAGV